MRYSSHEIKQLAALLLSPERSNKRIALGLLELKPYNVSELRIALCITSYLSDDFDDDIEGLAHNLLINELSEEELYTLQNQIIILDYVQYKFSVPEGWNSYQNPLQKYLRLHLDVIDSYMPLFKINPEPYSILYCLLAGRINKEWLNHKKALYFYEKSLELNPENSQAQVGFAKITHGMYIKKGKRLKDVDLVLQYYINAYKDPKNIICYNNAAMLCKDIGDIDRSAYYYEEGLSRCPDDSLLLNNYANLLMKFKGDYSQAKKLATKGLSIAPINTSLLDTLAHIEFLGFKNYEKAEQLFQKALKFKGEAHYSHTGLGDMYLEMGNYQLAEHFYIKGLHNGLQYISREVIEVVEKLEKLVVLYSSYIIQPQKADYYQHKKERLCGK
ncbi:tetratricopeptide repeat protein [Aureispira]|nr:tetratricopeptide repeat protein [Aureispira sp.]